MMLQLVLVCCVVRWAAADDTLFFVPHSQLSKNMSCPDNTQCPVGNTCCPTQDSNQFGCCPYNNAVCCSDGVHCCQKGTECRPDGGGCVHPNSVSEQVKTLIAKSVLCPDRQGMCPNGQSCCEGRNGEYACCKFDGGVCCADKIHCCPAGLTCDLQAGRCVKKGIRYLLTTLFNRPLTRTSPVLRPDEGIKCSDGSTCPNGNTCCKMSTGSVGCCPLPKAIAVEKVSTSVKESYLDISLGGGAKGKPPRDVVLGDRLPGDVSCNSSFSCPSGYSCCQMPTGRWWCCSYPDAFCCADGYHCCPSGTVRCDIPEKKCDQKDGSSVPWVTKVAAIAKDPIKCDTNECQGGNKDKTLDKVSPLLGESSAGLSPGGGSEGKASPNVVLGDGFLGNRLPGDVSCNSSFSCPSGYSCCQMPTGRWWCCSYPDAFCCADGYHCCPSGTVRCDIPEKKCDQQDGSSVPWVTKVAAIATKTVKCDTNECQGGKKDNSLDKVSPLFGESSAGLSPGGGSEGKASPNVVLGDGFLGNRLPGDVSCNSSFSCPSGYSCCQMPTGRWWCCSYPDAFCCADGYHCCPSGTVRCDIPEKKCDQQDGSSVPWVTKVAAIATKTVKCDTNECQGGNKDKTMDKVSPLLGESSAGLSPGGGSEGKASPNVVLGDGFLGNRLPGDVSCNSSFSCPSGYSCCQMPTGRWWCCSYPDAFCCADGYHCCPSGTVRCDIPEKKCDQQDGSSVPWVTKVAAIATKTVKCDTNECQGGKKDNSLDKVSPLFEESSAGLSPGGGSEGKASPNVVLGDGFLGNRLPGDVSCNSSFSCPSGYSCCQMPTGRWWCCSYPDAFCCADGYHCCPSGTVRCDIPEKKCDQQDGSSVPWFTKVAAIAKDPVKCDTNECQGGNKDNFLDKSSTSLGESSPGLSLEGGSLGKASQDVVLGDGYLGNGLPGDVSCNSSFSCPNGYSCCQMPTGRWWCCSYPDAFCCADGVHCCPSGTVRCDIPGKKCDQQDGSFVPWVTKVAAKVKDPVQCDNAHECPEGNTCCRQSSGQWGCCAIPQAVCCSDGEHCCQSGTTCDVTKGTCDRQDGFSVSWFKKTSAISRKVEDVVCPGGTSQCPDGNTCCKLSGGQWGCCPLPQAVCCSDGTHCCPTGTTCDVSQGKCSREDGTSLAWSKKTSSINRKVEDVVCPGGTSQCPDGNTCCKLSGGQWGCCPLPQAVCCSDGVHCCPSGTTCEVSTGKCNKQDGSSVSWFEKTSAINMKVEMVKCDDTHECPDGNTCCKLSTGQWGCCPLPRAVCCSDGVHCCPSGTTCEVSTGKCNKQDGASVTWFEKTSAFRSQVENVKCPDGESECPDGNTCCKLSAGQWGCCPLPQAVCCPDGTHCCPSGTTCDATSGSCIRQDGFSMTWFEKSPALKKDAEKVICPDQTSECPDGSTCCKLSGGQFGCCPIPKAVCCSDGVHCCPSGTTCDVSQGKCNRGDGTTVDWMKKTKAVNAEGGIQVVDSYSDSMRNRQQKPSHVEMIEEETVTCPGQEVECPGGSTCCKLLDDSWGCCPYAKASCCSDGVHCCPAGMSCNAEQGTCSKDGLSFSWTDKKPARAKKVHKEDLSSEGTDPVEVDLDLKTVVGNVKCSALSSCPDNQTCCPTSGSNFGCCPLPKGVCCPDHIHCCPMNTECSMTHRSCVVKDKVIPWLERVNEPLKIPSRPYAVMCPDGKSECPDGSTCCTLSSGTYGCCPLPDAKCCTDGVHCCPHGTTCDVAHGKCIQADGTLTLISTSTAASNVEMVRCPDGQSECEDGNTCCKLPTGQYGCCPLPKAVCCSDGVHCCPSGTTCEVSSGKCKRKDGISMTWFKKTSAFRSQVENVVCPGGQSECPDGNTCCKLITGQWGCCPLPQAVCCWDGTHCCPSGTTCEVSTGKCNRQDGSSVSWFEKTAAVQKDVTIQDEPSVEKDKVFFCNGTKKKCNNGQTCCPGVDGQYGCCVFSNGVCCSDGTHCCPSGTMCEVESGHCLKRGHILSSSMDLQEVHQEQLKDVQMIKCPDGTSECPDGNTCCKQSTGQYGCCPLEKAVCCSDGVHCCPSGTTCDVSQGKCNRQDGISVSWFKKTTAVSKKVEMVKCDESHECPDGNTCCKLSSGQFGCCPLPQAVCCSDGVHCCPSGTTCEVSTGKCNRQDGSSVTWFEKTLAVSRNVEDVVCPGGTSQCPDGNTCCKLSGGQYGCCPIPQAVCCSDGVHCCPSGTTCDVSQGTCSRQDGSVVAWLKKTVAGAIKQEVKDKTCEDGSKCPNGSSCCELRSGTYGCCPLPNAVCCTDGVHCCPQGYTCDDTSGTCSQGFLRIPFS